MICEFAAAKHVVGVKQSRRAVSDGTAAKAFAARDADPDIVNAFAALCEKKGVELVKVDSMKELGEACGINVGAAVAVLIK